MFSEKIMIYGQHILSAGCLTCLVKILIPVPSESGTEYYDLLALKGDNSNQRNS